MADGAMAIRSVPEGIAWQADHAEKAGAPGTARIIRGLLAAMETDTATGRRIADWHGAVVEDALPLRIAGGLHNLLLTGEDRALEPVYAGLTTEQGAVDAIVCELFERYDTQLLPWLDSPPQTNEAGRSASVMTGLMWLSERTGCGVFELNEIGASAGINTMMDGFGYDLGGVRFGLGSPAIELAPEWRGPPPSEAPVDIVALRGCDRQPIDLTDAAQARRLKSYVWPEATERMGRIDAAVRMAGVQKPDVARADAADWVEQMLAEPQEEGVMRVLWHSIVWQYLGEPAQERIEAAMEQAGEAASAERPLAWIMLETNRETFAHELRVRHWPGDGEWHLLGQAHPHGAWVEWFGR